jgi:hypothetical protein
MPESTLQAEAARPPRSPGVRPKGHGAGWWITLIVLIVGIFAVVYLITGMDALGAAVRVVWNAIVFAFNTVVRFLGEFSGVIARALGMRRLGRLAAALASVGLVYAGGVIMNDEAIAKAHGWRDKLKAGITVARNWWHDLHVGWKLGVVAVLIASQVYLHFLLILFPIAFLVPFVRQFWVQAVDIVFGGWYRKTHAARYEAIKAKVKALPGCRQFVGWRRITRLRYLCAWRLWKYDPHYLRPGSHRHTISFIEPMRLWWRGELDRYVGHPLLAGPGRGPPPLPPLDPGDPLAAANEGGSRR